MARKPFKDPIDDEADAEEGTKRSIREFEERVASEDPVEVPVEEEDDDPDAELDEPTDRKGKRAARGQNYRTVREQRAAAEARAQALQEQLDRLSAQQAAMSQPQGQQSSQANPQLDQKQQELSRVVTDQERLFSDYQAAVNRYRADKKAMPESEYETFKKRAEELDEKKIDLRFEIREIKQAPQRQQQEIIRLYQSKAPDVFSNQRAYDYASTVYRSKLLANPQANADETFDQAIEEARTVILGKRPAPGAASKQRATGMSRGVSNGNGNQPARIQMTPGQRAMARSAYPKLSEKEAYQKWANVNGRKLLELEREHGRG